MMTEEGMLKLFHILDLVASKMKKEDDREKGENV
jgi:hypothetical protein